MVPPRGGLASVRRLSPTRLIAALDFLIPLGEPTGMSTASLDRRARRRQQTIDEVLDTALEIMTEQGAGGLSLGEIARRMGMRPPSLYVYFASKHAIYDALFARGARELLDTMQEATNGFAASENLADTLLNAGSAMVRW